jgi:hypothetical protein
MDLDSGQLGPYAAVARRRLRFANLAHLKHVSKHNDWRGNLDAKPLLKREMAIGRSKLIAQFRRERASSQASQRYARHHFGYGHGV